MICQHCQSTTGVIERTNWNGETQTICPTCIDEARKFVAGFQVGLLELADLTQTWAFQENQRRLERNAKQRARHAARKAA